MHVLMAHDPLFMIDRSCPVVDILIGWSVHACCSILCHWGASHKRSVRFIPVANKLINCVYVCICQCGLNFRKPPE